MILQPSKDAEPFKVFPENWDAVQMFLRLETQWRTGPRGLIGLDYRVMEWLLSLYPAADARALLDDVQVMESAVLDAIYKLEG